MRIEGLKVVEIKENPAFPFALMFEGKVIRNYTDLDTADRARDNYAMWIYNRQYEYLEDLRNA